MSKKLIALLLSAAICGTLLVSCTNSGNDDTTENPVDSTDDTTEAPAAAVTVEDLHEAVKNAYGEEGYLPNMPLDPEMFASIYGVQADWVEEYVAETPMISMNVDTLIIVKPTEGNEENVLNALTAYADYMKNGSLQYPSNEQKVKAVQCYAKGGFVFYYILGILSDDVLFAEGEPEEIAELQYNAALANNQKATDAINALLGE